MNINQPSVVVAAKAADNTEPVTADATSTASYDAQHKLSSIESGHAGGQTADSSAQWAKPSAVRVPSGCGCGSSVKAMRRTAQSMFS